MRALTLFLLATTLFCLGCGDDDASKTVVSLTESRDTDLVIHSDEILEIDQIVSFVNGASLYLEAGAEVHFLADILLQISGSLVAGETGSDLVRIVGSSTNPMGGMWVRGDSLVLDGVKVQGLGSGILADEAMIHISNCQVLDCESGLYCNDSPCRVSDCEFQGNALAIAFASSEVEAEQLVLRENTVGIELSGCRGTVTGSQLSNNVTAIYCGAWDSTLVSWSEFEGNDHGIEFYYSYPLLKWNSFSEDRLSVFLSAYSRHDVVIQNNDFYRARQYSLFIPMREWNNPHSLDVSDNFWNTSAADSISAWIYDGYDYTPCDTLVFQPVAGTPFTDF